MRRPPDDRKAGLGGHKPARRPTSASGGPESRVMSREEWRKEIGPFWEDATDEAVEKGLAFIITGGPAPSRKTPKGGER